MPYNNFEVSLPLRIRRFLVQIQADAPLSFNGLRIKPPFRTAPKLAFGNGFLLAKLDHPDLAAQAGRHLPSARRILARVLQALPPNEQAEARREIVRELQAGQDGQLPIAHGWSVWRASANRESDPKARTLAGYEAMWRRFQGWAGKSGIAHLHEASRAHAEAYAEDLWNSGVSPSTFNQHIKLLRPAFL